MTATTSTPSTHADRLRALAGAQLARDRWSRFLGRYLLFSTAGTSGVRGLFVDDTGEFAVWSGTCLRGMASWDLGPATRLAGIGSPSPLHISSAVYTVLPAGKPSSVPRLTVATPLPEMVTALNDYQPEALAGRCRPECPGTRCW